MDAFDASPLCPAPTELRLQEIRFKDRELIVTASARRHVAACPVCGRSTNRVHSRYRRTLADLPWHGLQVRLDVQVRRFFCDLPECPRRIFTERLPKTATPYARRTARAMTALEAIAFALGGRAGARLADALGLPIGATAMVAHVRGPVDHVSGNARNPDMVTTRVLGVDDWAWRKGQRYGTILVDLERHRVVDLLPDREPTTLAAWLKAHPGVEFISRDRAGAYAEGAREGAPAAIQVADRFHLVRNLMEAVERACLRHHAELRAASDITHPKPLPAALTRKRPYSDLPNNRPGPTTREQRALERRAGRVARYGQVVALRAQGLSKRAIAATVGLDRRTVAVWLAAHRFPERAQRPRRPHRLDIFADYIIARYDGGLDNAAQLAHELRGRGFRGNDTIVRRYLADLRRVRPRGTVGVPSADTHEARSIARPAPSPRETAWLLRKGDSNPDALRPEEQAYVEALCTTCPALDRVRSLATEFARVLAERDSSALDVWLAAADRSELRAFAAGLRRDHDAVLAALVFPWSNGQVEGQVQRLKLIKRTMYGRASFDLLRRRVVHAA